MNKYFLLTLLMTTILSCQSNTDNNQTTEIEKSNNNIEISELPIQFYGNTQGTTYSIIVNDNVEITHQEIDDLLHQFDLALSSYIPNSILSQLNSAPAGEFVYRDSFNYFNRCLKQSQTIFKLSNGAFDPTVYPLVDGWGFMKNLENVPDSATVDSLLSLVGFQDGYHFKFNPSQSDSALENSSIIKRTPNAKLDFNAIAQGLSVDVVCEELIKRGAHNFMVEIGGELRVKGKNAEGHYWRIGIDKPIEKSNAQNREFQEIIEVKNKAVATSGSYRKYYEKNGIKYSHTLNPKTGYPVKHSLLSVTVVADNCALADGLATAFMVMGPDKTVKFVKSKMVDNIEVYLIFNNTKGRIETYQSNGFKQLILSDEDFK